MVYDSPDEGDPNWRPHRPDLMRGMTPAIPISNQMPASTQLYPYHQQGFTHSPPTNSPPTSTANRPHQNRSMSNLSDPPPLPPKPIVYPVISSHGDHDQVSYSAPPLPPPLPSSPPPLAIPQDEAIVPTEDSDELAMVLALSQSESVRKKLLEEQLMNQEEEDLARALAASMLPSESYFPSPTNESSEPIDALGNPWIQSSPSHKPLASPPTSLPVTPGGPSEELSLHDPYAEFGRYDKWRIPNLPEKQQEEAPKSLEPQLRPSLSTVSLLPYASAIDGDKSSLQHGDADESPNFLSSETVLKFDNAAYTRQPASDEENILNQPLISEEGQQDGFVNQVKSSSTSYGKQNAEGRPQSARVASNEEPYGRQYPQDTRVSTNSAAPTPSVPTYSPAAPSAFSAPPAPDYGFPSIGKANSYQPDIYQEKRKQSLSFSPIAYPSLGSRRGSASDSHSETSQSQTSSPIPHNDKPRLHLDVPQFPATSEGRRRSTVSTLPSQPIASTSATPLNQPPQTAGLLNINHFVDQELLCGVSIGFKSPIISTRLAPMQEQMPNIISLPYTRCPPLHLQAPDWRHLLRLMARLSGTRIEPSIEATTVSKVELKLRTVIQFIKPHPSSNDWRSVLWFTIEQPVPVASASRYASGNPNLLPYSYTLSPIPVLLRGTSDTNISKTYTIPATDTIPLPTLPITFPDLALYLQAALDTSRRYLSDSPNGLGKLGKMVQTCYPNIHQDPSENEPERTRVSQYFKRVIGLSSKDKKKTKGTNNEDTYQLVTPFIPNEWG